MRLLISFICPPMLCTVHINNKVFIPSIIAKRGKYLFLHRGPIPSSIRHEDPRDLWNLEAIMLYVWYISMRTSEAHLSLCPWPVQWVQLYQQQHSPQPARRSSGGWTEARCRWRLWRWGTPTQRWTDWDCPCLRQVWSERRGGSVKIMNTFLIHYPVLVCFRPKPINLALFMTFSCIHVHLSSVQWEVILWKPRNPLYLHAPACFLKFHNQLTFYM